LNNFLQNQGVFHLGELSSLLLAIKMNGAAHENERGIQPLLVDLRIKVLPGIQDDRVVDAFLLAIWIDAYVSKNSQA
jgi:hypothetical protein